MRPSFAGGILAAVLMGGVSAQALAADLTIWWNKSYYPEEDKQFDKIVTDFEKEKEYRYRILVLHERGRAAEGAGGADRRRAAGPLLRLPVRSAAHRALGLRGHPRRT
jgi:hypothetical protein